MVENGELLPSMVLRKTTTASHLVSAYSSMSGSMIDLILVLIEHERTRMTIWKDPRNRFVMIIIYANMKK
jgi:hypothetical protein